MKTKTITTYNAVDVVYFPETDKQLVPIKPILKAMNQNCQHETSKMFQSDFWVDIIRATSTDEKEIEHYGLIALPIAYVPGWIFNLERDRRWETHRTFNRTRLLLYNTFMDYIKQLD